MRLPIKSFALILLALLLGACAGREKDRADTMPVEEIYDLAKRSLDRGNYARAEQEYKRLIARFPFGPYSEQAQLELAYAQYKMAKSDEALSTIERFIRTYPRHEKIAYAYYLRALISFDREFSFLDRWLRRPAWTRDLEHLRRAFSDFGELIQRFPDTEYAADARQRMIYLRNVFAQSEIDVASFYLRHEAWVAAANRARYVIENYPQAPQNADALAILAYCYERLGEKQLAEDTRRVLERNFPNHPFLSGGWPREKTLWQRLIPFG